MPGHLAEGNRLARAVDLDHGGILRGEHDRGEAAAVRAEHHLCAREEADHLVRGQPGVGVDDDALVWEGGSQREHARLLVDPSPRRGVLAREHDDLRALPRVERCEQRVDIVTRRGEHLPARRELVRGRGDEEDLRAVVDAAALYAARRVAVPRGVGLDKDERGLRNIEQLQEAPGIRLWPVAQDLEVGVGLEELLAQHQLRERLYVHVVVLGAVQLQRRVEPIGFYVAGRGAGHGV